MKNDDKRDNLLVEVNSYAYENDTKEHDVNPHSTHFITKEEIPIKTEVDDFDIPEKIFVQYGHRRINRTRLKRERQLNNQSKVQSAYVEANYIEPKINQNIDDSKKILRKSKSKELQELYRELEFILDVSVPSRCSAYTSNFFVLNEVNKLIGNLQRDQKSLRLSKRRLYKKNAKLKQKMIRLIK